MRTSIPLAAAVVLALSGCRQPVSAPTPTAAPSQPANPRHDPTASFPSIEVGEAVRFRFTAEDGDCVGVGGGACRSYAVHVPADGQLETVLASVDGDAAFTATTELYVVPGGDFWTVGPGARISVTIPVRAMASYEIRMFAARVPSPELELRATLR